jgi:hypothetical protein
MPALQVCQDKAWTPALAETTSAKFIESDLQPRKHELTTTRAIALLPIAKDKMPGTRGPVPVPLKDGNRDVTQEILDYLSENDSFKSTQQFSDIPQAELKAALDRLWSRSMVEYQQETADYITLLPEGETIVKDGSPEYRVWQTVLEKGKIGVKELGVRAVPCPAAPWEPIAFTTEANNFM